MMEVRSDINALTAIEAIGKLSQMEQAYAAITAERDEWKRRLYSVIEAIKPAQIKWSKSDMDSPEYHAWCLVAPLYGQAIAIAEGRDNG